MKRAKLRLEQIWPTPESGVGSRRNDTGTVPTRPKGSPNRAAQPRPVPSQAASRPAKPKGSYYLRRGWSMVVRSVYLTRVLEGLERGYRDSGERFFSNLALVWVSRDGSRECALKGRALRDLVLGKS